MNWTRSIDLTLKSIVAGNVISWAAASVIAVLTVFLCHAQLAAAAWEEGQISVSDGKGGTNTYAVQKQKFKVPDCTYVMPFGLAQMDDGRIIFAASLETETTHKAAVCYSSDEGKTWTDFQTIPPITGRPTMLTYLGGPNLTMFGTGHFSNDYGKTWTIEKPVDEHYAANEGNGAVDRDPEGKATRRNGNRLQFRRAENMAAWRRCGVSNIVSIF